MWVLSWVESNEILKFKPVVRIFETQEEAQALEDEIIEKVDYELENSETCESNIVSEIYIEEINLPLKDKVDKENTPPAQR